MESPMITLRNRRSVRRLAIGIAANILLAGPTCLLAQDTTSAPIDQPNTHTVRPGDTLWDLAAKYLADAFRWPEIYRLNTDLVDDPHWIYPGEVLKLPGYVAPGEPPVGEPAVGVVQPTPAIVAAPVQPSVPAGPTIFGRRAAPVPTGIAPVGQPIVADTQPAAPPASSVLYSDFIKAPWVERRKGPVAWGRIIGSADIPGIEPAKQRARYQLNDPVLITPPPGSVGAMGELYLTYRFGPLIEDVGQVIVPTGVLEVVREPRNGDAGVARVSRMFGDIQEHDRLIPYDSSALSISGVPVPVSNGVEGEVQWVPDEPVLASLDHFIVLTLTSRDGVRIGDQVELFQKHQKPADQGLPGIPEIFIGHAAIVKVTEFGSTAIITSLDQPKVIKGTAVRVIAKMQ
jgi:LysM repeat protein